MGVVPKDKFAILEDKFEVLHDIGLCYDIIFKLKIFYPYRGLCCISLNF